MLGDTASIQQRVSLLALYLILLLLLPSTSAVPAPSNLTRSSFQLIGDTKQTVQDLISHVLLEFHVQEPVLRLGDSLAEADPDAEAALLEGETLIVEEGRVQHHPRAEGDARYRLTETLLAAERRYLTSVRAVEQIYGTPLRKLSSISAEEHRQLFTGIQPVCSVSAMLVNKLECALAAWDKEETRVGGLFSKQLLTQYEDYKEFYSRARELLREKQTTDEEFVEFCKLRRGAAKHTLDTLLSLPTGVSELGDTFPWELAGHDRTEDAPDSAAAAAS
ncbi:uncharacterized protein LOC122369708 [Amphibalanus amphitrite]|uniref:uncharacterized protein LOC122369708 n=1 Tax=Amphibalanus amphitrite TaxID=1232801 RepID=UPI001C9066BF|nr:uncharacterized protein LOC122369708 [Amphibalanus amphitrite]